MFQPSKVQDSAIHNMYIYVHNLAWLLLFQGKVATLLAPKPPRSSHVSERFGAWPVSRLPCFAAQLDFHLFVKPPN